MVSDNCVANSSRYKSEGVDDNNSNYGVRPVVALKSNVNVSQNGSGIWTLNAAHSGEKSIVLPRSYQKVEYIENTGAEYIDTNYLPKTNTELQLEVSFSGSFYNSTGTTLIQSMNTDKNNCFQLNFGGNANQYNTLFPWINKVYGKGGQIESFVITDQIRNNKNLITMKSGLVIYGGVARQLSDKTVDNNNSLLLLAGRSDSSSIITFRAYTARIYGLKLLEGDKLKRNFIPCYCTSSVTNVDGQSCPSGTIGLYDTVEGKFYTNQGTGAFVKGNDV